MRIRPSIVIQKENSILLMRYEYNGKSLFQFPGGNMDELETLEETVERELFEELTLSITVNELLLSAQVINRSKKQGTLHCLFKGEIKNNSVPIINTKETTAIEAVWVDLSQLEKLNLYPSVGKSLKNILSNQVTNPVYLGLIDQPWI